MVLQRVLMQLMQQYLVKTLASSPAFQRLALNLAGKLQSAQKAAEQTAQQVRGKRDLQERIDTRAGYLARLFGRGSMSPSQVTQQAKKKAMGAGGASSSATGSAKGSNAAGGAGRANQGADSWTLLSRRVGAFAEALREEAGKDFGGSSPDQSNGRGPKRK